jgi:hypothetical protein
MWKERLFPLEQKNLLHSLHSPILSCQSPVERVGNLLNSRESIFRLPGNHINISPDTLCQSGVHYSTPIWIYARLEPIRVLPAREVTVLSAITSHIHLPQTLCTHLAASVRSVVSHSLILYFIPGCKHGKLETSSLCFSVFHVSAK